MVALWTQPSGMTKKLKKKKDTAFSGVPDKPTASVLMQKWEKGSFPLLSISLGLNH